MVNNSEIQNQLSDQNINHSTHVVGYLNSPKLCLYDEDDEIFARKHIEDGDDINGDDDKSIHGHRHFEGNAIQASDSNENTGPKKIMKDNY
jgi:hypothetical protein